MFKFELSQRVKLVESSERGTVIGRCEYLQNEATYLIRYRAGDGRQVETWWAETALEPA